jgi:hypothetical protein
MKVKEYEAFEMQYQISSGTNYTRAIRYGRKLIIRRGERSGTSRRHVEWFPLRLAVDRFDAIKAGLVAQGYATCYRDGEITHGPFANQRLTSRPSSSSNELEQLFLQRWHDESPVTSPEELTNPAVYWDVYERVLVRKKVDPFYQFFYEDALKVPHAIDEVRDLVLVPVLGSDLNDHLGPYLAEHTAEVARVALELYYPGHPRPKEIFSAASSLVAAA